MGLVNWKGDKTFFLNCSGLLTLKYNVVPLCIFLALIIVIKLVLKKQIFKHTPILLKMYVLTISDNLFNVHVLYSCIFFRRLV